MNPVQCVKTECDLFEDAPVQTSIIGDNIVTLKPVSSLDSKSQLEFFYGGGGADMYLDLSNTYLRIKLSLSASTPAAGSTAAVYDVGFVNNILFSLFSSCEIYLNEVNITPSSSDHFNMKTYIQTLLRYSSFAAETHLFTSGFALDKVATGATGAPLGAEANTGWAKRLELFSSGKEVVLHSRLPGDLMDQPKLIPSGTDIRIRLVFAEENFYLWSDAAGGQGSAKVTVSDATLFLRQVQINPSHVIAHHKALEKHPFIYPMKRSEIRTWTLPLGVNSFNIHQAISGVLPDRITCCFVESDGFHGNIKKSPYSFVHSSLSSISLVVNGVEKKIDDFTFGAGGNHITAYSSLYEGTNINRDNASNLVTYDMFAKGYSIFGWDLTPDKSGHVGHTSVKQLGNVRLHGNFTSNTTSPLTCVVYAEYSCVMELDKYRKPTVV